MTNHPPSVLWYCWLGLKPSAV